MQKLQKAPQRFFEGGIVGEALGKALEGVGLLYRAMKGSDKIKNALGKIGEKAQRELDLDGNTTTLSSMGGGEIDKGINKIYVLGSKEESDRFEEFKSKLGDKVVNRCGKQHILNDYGLLLKSRLINCLTFCALI